MMKNHIAFCLMLFFSTYFFSQTKQEYLGGCRYLETNNYIINNDGVIFENCNIHRETTLDPSTTRIFANGFASDVKNIYFKGIKMDVSPEGFEVFPNDNYYSKDLVWKSKDYIFLNRKIITKINPSDFEYKNHGYFINGGLVYHLDQKLENSDAGTFVASYQFSFDKNNVYKDGIIVEIGGKPAKAINGYFVKDDQFVYQFNYMSPKNPMKIDSIAIENSQALPKSNYAILNDYLYNGDLKTFYLGNHKNEITTVSEDFIKFKNFAIYINYTIYSLDIPSLKIDNESGFLSDKNGIYIPQEKISNKKSYNIKEENLKFEKVKSLPKPKANFTSGNTLKNINNTIFYNNEVFIPKKTLEASSLKELKNLRLVSILAGYRKGCSQDPQPYSNTYILKNDQGYWNIYKTYEKISIDFIGSSYNY